MLSGSDKAWVAGLVSFLGYLLSSKIGLSFVTPELIALVTGAATWWVPNKAAPVPPAPSASRKPELL